MNLHLVEHKFAKFICIVRDLSHVTVFKLGEFKNFVAFFSLMNAIILKVITNYTL
jgi:hypothetical protein